MRGRNRLILTRVCIFLLLGAIVNVAVAWSWWLWPHDTYSEMNTVDQAVTRWTDWAPEGWTQNRNGWLTITGPFLTWEAAFAQADGSEVSGGVAVYYEGWPLRSLQGCWINRSVKCAFTLTCFDRRDGYLCATKPLWPGFAINTIFYAAILWLLWIAPGKVRRFVRVRRRRCPACGYPVGTSPVCTECGHPLTSKGARRAGGAG